MRILKNFNLILKKATGLIKLVFSLSAAWTVFASSIYLVNYLISIHSKQYFLEQGFLEFVLWPIIIAWVCVGLVFWMKSRNIGAKIMNKVKVIDRTIIEGVVIIFIAYLFLYPYICTALNLYSDIFTIPTMILLLVLNKTLWMFIFLFWFGWKLLFVLWSLNDTWKKSLIRSDCYCKSERLDVE